MALDADIAFASTASLARLIAQGDVKAVELVDLYARRHEEYGRQVNAVIQHDFDKARDAAKAADAALAADEEIEPLHGVPFTIKECFEVLGFRATPGAPELAYNTPSKNADAVTNLLGAGALVMGKTNIPYMAIDIQSYNDVFGTTNNPWDVTRTCGGSSGGAAAALAAGLTGGDIGSDIGGSLRNPAHYNGVYSHKPSYGLISQYGHIPPAPGAAIDTDLNVMGPMGRSAEDLRLLLDILMRPVGVNRHSVLSMPRARQRQLEDFRVAIWPGHSSNRSSHAVAARMDALQKALQGNVAKLEETWPLKSTYETLIEVYAQLLLGALSAGASKRDLTLGILSKPIIACLKALGLHQPGGLTGFLDGTAQSHRAWLQANEKRAAMRHEIDAFFEDFDVLLAPVVPWTAPPHNQSGELVARKVLVDGIERPYTDAIQSIALATALNLPATTAPIGLAEDGLPVGVQIIGPYMHDYTTIAFADALAEVIGGFQAPPNYGAHFTDASP
ncbi:MAG: amidase [Sphingomonadales bacterium]